MRSWWGAVVFAAGCNLVGVLGALTTGTGNSDWYQALEKPWFQPPGWVFGPVWTILYALMGLAAWRVWRRGTATPGVRPAMAWFAFQLTLNAAWSPVFFGAHAIIAALAILAALCVAVAGTVIAFRRVERLATALLLPYLAWVTFALILNAALARLN